MASDKDEESGGGVFSVVMKVVAGIVAVLVGWGAYATAVEATTTINWGLRLARAEKFVMPDPSWQKISMVEHPAILFCEDAKCPPDAEVIYQTDAPVTAEQVQGLLRSNDYRVNGGDCQHGNPASLCTIHGIINSNFIVDAKVTRQDQHYDITVDLHALR